MSDVTVQSTLGAMQIGITVAVFLFGAITLQFNSYAQHFTEDRLAIRFLAGTVWILEFAHTICITAEAYRGTILFYGNLTGYTWSPFMGVAILMGGLITMVVQCFFCFRVWRALPFPVRYVGVLCGIASSLRGVGSVYLGSRVIRARTLEEYRKANGWLIRGLLGSGAAIDIIIAIVLLYFLWKKRQTSMSTSTRILDYLVAYTIRTGLLTSVTSIIVLATFQSHPETFIWVGAYVVLAKLYTASLFSALNARRHLRDIVTEGTEALSSKALRKRFTQTELGGGPTITIQMNTTVNCDVDIENDLATRRKLKSEEDLDSSTDSFRDRRPLSNIGRQ
ncbi:hypothetical protein D9611_012690 [Ephemerocybe angulata]|uniref:DUF6534 domain-containing protein n=1 Tax=Ephemerocybe angulata TaxID=980116 RepID=A0A8H5B983_9AGAR|nr:hypothetical protein D9611_012690 [Tulosesus angulatus]